MKTNYWYSILILAMLGLYGVNGAISITAATNGNVIAANGQQFTLTFVDNTELIACNTSTTSPFKVVSTTIEGTDGSSSIAQNSYVCTTSDDAPYFGKSDVLSFITNSGTDVCNNVISSDVSGIFYPIQLNAEKQTSSGAAGTIFSVHLNFEKVKAAGNEVPLWTAIPGNVSGGTVTYGQNTDWINKVGFSNFKQCDYSTTAAAADDVYIVNESSQKIYLCYVAQASWSGAAWNALASGQSAYTTAGAANNPVKWQHLNICKPLTTSLVDILGQSCTTTQTVQACAAGTTSMFMFVDVSNSNNYKYACGTGGTAIAVGQVTYSGAVGTTHIQINTLSIASAKPAKYAKQITVDVATVATAKYVTGVNIVASGGATSDTEYVINIPLYGLESAASTKLVRSTAYKATINLTDTNMFGNGKKITSIVTTLGANTNYIKEGNVYYIVST